MKESVKRVILFVLSALVFLFIIVYYVALDRFLENLVARRLSSYINDTPDRIYDIKYGSLDISVSDRAVRIGKLSISPRKFAIDSMKNDHLSMLMSVKVDSFYFDGLRLFKLLVLNKLEIDEIVADNPKIRYYFNPKAKIPTEEGKLSENILTEKLQHALLHQFKIENGHYFAIQLPERDSIYFEMDSSSMIVDDISILPAEEDLFKMVYFDSLQFISGKFYGGFVKNYRIDARSIEFSTKRQLLVIDSLAFLPKHFDMADTSAQWAHDIFTATVKTIEFQGLNLSEDGGLNDYMIRKLKVSAPDFSVSTDKRLPKNTNRKPLLAELIRKIPVPFSLDTIEISNGKILYHEVTSGDKVPLDVFFTNVNLLGTNVTNDSARLKVNPDLEVNVNSKFLGAGSLKVNVKVPVLSTDNKMIVNGEMGPMTFEPVTKMLEGPMQVRIISGKINSMVFQFVADTSRATGNLDFDYSNMKIQIFKSNEDTNAGKKEVNKWFLNAIVNGIVKTNNNKGDVKFATGLIDYERPDDIAIPGYLYRSLKSGLLTTLIPGKRHGDEAMERRKEQTKEKQEEKKEIRREKAGQKAVQKAEQKTEKETPAKKDQKKKKKKKKSASKK